MKIKLLLMSALLLSLASCWSPDYVEDARVAVDLGKQQLVPYQKDEKINFIHSRGYVFDFIVTRSDVRWIEHEPGEGGCIPTPSLPKTIHYTTYQEKWVTLRSDYPNLNITFMMDSRPENADKFRLNVNRFYTDVYVDKNYQFVPDNTNGNSVLYDSMVINGKTYNNVLEVKLTDGENDYINVLYNELGLLQIKFSDDETFSINN